MSYADAATLYRSTLEKNPQCWLCHNNLGDIYAQQGSVLQAEAHWRKAAELCRL